MYASHFNWLQVSFRRTSLSSTGFESRKGERFPRAQGRRYLPVSASILLYFESLILNPTLRCERACARASKDDGRCGAERRQVFAVCASLTALAVALRGSPFGRAPQSDGSREAPVAAPSYCPPPRSGLSGRKGYGHARNGRCRARFLSSAADCRSDCRDRACRHGGALGLLRHRRVLRDDPGRDRRLLVTPGAPTQRTFA